MTQHHASPADPRCETLLRSVRETSPLHFSRPCSCPCTLTVNTQILVLPRPRLHLNIVFATRLHLPTQHQRFRDPLTPYTVSRVLRVLTYPQSRVRGVVSAGARAEDHANGRAVSYWLKLRTAARAGDTVQVKAAYRAGTATAHAPAPVPAAAAAVAHDSRGNRKSKSSTIKDGKTGDGTSGSGSGSRDHGKESAKKASAEQVAAAAAAAARHKAAVAAAVLNPVSSAGLRWAAAAAAAKQELRAKRLALLAKKMKSETPLLPPSRTVAAKQLPGGTAKVRPAVQPARKESGAGAVAVAGAGAGPGAVAGGAASAGLEAESRKSSKSLRKRIAASLVVAVEKRRKA